MYQYLETVGLKAEFSLFKCCLVAPCKIQFKVPRVCRGVVCHNETKWGIPLCARTRCKVSDLYPQWWMEMIGVRHLDKAGDISREGVQSRGFYSLGYPCASLCRAVTGQSLWVSRICFS